MDASKVRLWALKGGPAREVEIKNRTKGVDVGSLVDDLGLPTTSGAAKGDTSMPVVGVSSREASSFWRIHLAVPKSMSLSSGARPSRWATKRWKRLEAPHEYPTRVGLGNGFGGM